MRLSFRPESDRGLQKAGSGVRRIGILAFDDKGRKLWAEAFAGLVVTFRPFESRSVLLNKAQRCR